MTDTKDYSKTTGLEADELELFEYLLEEEGVSLSVESQPIVRVKERERLPLSFAQQRLWFLDQLQPGSAAYNMAGALQISGRLDVKVLERSLNEILRRHEALRTTFQTHDGQPVQVIAPVMHLALPLIDLSRLSEADRESALKRLSQEEAGQSFDLSRGLLIRGRLLRLTGEKHQLLLTMHHIISDGWSIGVLIREVAALYEAYSRGEASPLEELPVQYADFAVWQREWLSGQTLDEQLAYWRQQLNGELPVLQLPKDFTSPASQKFQGATHTVLISKKTSEGLQRLSRQEGATLFMTLLAAFSVLLSRYSHQREILIGTPVAGRTRSETEQLIGFFVNTLVMRTRLEGEATFREVLRQVRETSLQAYAHQDVPFEKLVEELAPERSLNQTPLFQVTFALQNSSLPEFEVSGLRMKAMEVVGQTAKFELTLEMEETPSGLKGHWQYSAELFEAATIESMARHFETLIEGIVGNPNLRVMELPLLSTTEQHQLLFESNETKTSYPDSLCLHQLFERQAERTPDAVALVFEGLALTYAELNRKANKLAHYLRRMGVAAETRVGILMERSVEMTLAVLGIMKAGGAYVPLDPAYPQERLSFMMDDAEVSIILMQERFSESLPESQAHLVCLDTEWEIIEREHDANPVVSLNSDNMIYVIYTSGSTGRPKGVMVPHRGVVNCLSWLQKTFRLTEQDCLLLKASLNFDASVWELFGAWLAGGRVVVARQGGQQDPGYLVRAIAENGVTTVHFVPSMLPLFLDEGELATVKASLRLVAFGGEAMPVETLERLQERLGVEAHNFYGPTEGCIGSIDWLCARDSERLVVPIGRPIDNTKAFVLDAHMRPVPSGVHGELFLGGDCVARGYLQRPELTAERFIPDPFTTQPGARLYRTGDLARYNRDGQIEFLGRLDHQVKIRGLRIELEEIEAVLATHEAVGECLVLAREDTPGDKRLVAYLVAAPGETLPETSLLRRYLRDRLPDYMIPTAFVALDSLPLTTSGKVDRRALPAPELENAAKLEDEQGARTAVEEIVAGIWCEVLGRAHVGVSDNFFELGGHSLLATQVMSRVREAFQTELPLSCFYESPVLSELASAIEASMKTGETTQFPPLERLSHGNVSPLSFAQQRLWFFDQLEPSSPIYNLPGGVSLRGSFNSSAFEQAMTELVRRHESLRTSFQMMHGQPVQVIEEARPFILPVVDLTALLPDAREQEAQTLAYEEARIPFDLTRGQLLRAKLLRLDAEDHLMLFTMHHIISDGWSMGVLIREVVELYKAFAVGEESKLQPLSLQYADYAAWQRAWLRDEVLEAQLAYWRERLRDMPPALELPSDRARPKVQTFEGATLPVHFSKQLTEDLKTLSRREGATLFMTLLAAFQTLLHRYTGQQDIATGTPIANRQSRETENLIGFFVNTLVMRTDLSGRPTFRELLKRVRETSLGAYAHQDVPFELLVEELHPERSQSYTPLFQTMLVLQNAPAAKLELPELSVSLIGNESGVSRFDLAFSLEESEQGLEGVCEYSTDLFDETTIHRLVGHFETLLASIVGNPFERLNALPLLTAAEERQLLVEWNETTRDFPRDVCIHELFERQACETPDSIALIFDDEQMTYRELQMRANRLANYLRTLGVGAETVVGIMMERSMETLVGLLGILQAGGAYLPLDPELPQERLSFMLEDAHARVLLTEQRFLERLAKPSAQVVCLDTDWHVITQQSERQPTSQQMPESTAYVVYTSGSTGRPKAVVMPHRPTVNFITYQIESSGAQSFGRTLQFASLSFDVSFQEIFATLCAGGTLVLLREDERRNAAELLHVIVNQRVERLFVPFVALQHMAETAEAEGVWPTTLRQVITAGEQLKVTPHIARCFKHLDGCILDNQYGPSETHLTTMLRLEGTADSWPKLPPIGRAVSNVRIYLLDEEMQPAPVGVTGEVFVGGDGLARGYLNRAAQTAERFIPDPFGNVAGGRLYRTGDLARYRADGVLEYVGRRDSQVKVRGFRVEVGEVEAVLKEHVKIKQAAVVPFDDESGRKQLAAYLVAVPGDAAPTVSELRSFLREKLLDYMIPTAFVLLDELPLTLSGKVDRRALPAPERQSSTALENYVAPANPVEEIVAGIWSELLHAERVGMEDNFFDIGGHSLLATQVISRLREAFRVELPVRALFERPTPKELAAVIVEKIKVSPQLSSISLHRRSREQHLPLSFAQQRLWFLDKLEPGNAFYNLTSAVRINGALDAEALARSFGEVIRRHEVLRTTFQTFDGQPVQVIAEASPFALPVTDLSHLSSAERAAQAQNLSREESVKPFELSQGLLVRARLLRLTSEAHQLLLTMHHIISDGWSIGVLIREVAALYQAYSRGEASTLPELEVQYADFAVWQREWLSGQTLDEQLAYWRSQLAGAPPVLELPTDFPRPAVKTFNGATQRFTLPRELSEELHRLSRQEGATLFMTLLAAFSVLLSRYSHQREILIGTPVANRTRTETEQLIGFFINTLVIRTRLEGEASFREILRQVRETSLQAYAHQDVPFEKLVEELAPERNLSYTPLFQVAFALQNAPMPDIELSGLQLSVLEIAKETAKFDLALSMQETEQGLEAEFEYNTDLFENKTIARMIEHFQTLLDGIIARPDERCGVLPLITPTERRQLLFELNDTAGEFPQDVCLHELFEAQAAMQPQAVACLFEDEQLTYDELNRRANRLAHQLIKLGIAPETRVAVLLERSLEMIVGVLGIVKAGGAYVPLDPAWPTERLAWILSSLNIGCLLTQSSLQRTVHDLQWKLPRLKDVVYLDVAGASPPAESLNEEVVQSLWDHVAERAVDEVTAGGFISSYTGEPFTAREVEEYKNRIVTLAKETLGQGKRVLEIGSGSGLIMFELAPQVEKYIGLDPSPVTQEKNRERIKQLELDNVELLTGFADRIDELEAESFDLIIMASTAQFFPGARYLMSVLEKAMRLLRKDGSILLGDVMDARRREEFQQSLLDYQSRHADARTKTQPGSELYFDEAFFNDAAAELANVNEVRILHRAEGFKNELGFRYDALLKKGEPGQGEKRERRKNHWTLRHQQDLPESNPARGVTAENVAYTIFTSGSTGVPKGVVVRHRSVVNLIDWVNQTFSVSPADRLLFITSLNFDLSVYDIFGTLAAGASFQIASRADLRDPQRLARILTEQPITFWDSAPVALQQLVPFFSAVEHGAQRALRLVFLSGDWIPLSLPDQVRSAFAGARVVSLGGATEATVWSNFFPVQMIASHWASIPYGRPIRNAQYYILDERLSPVPVGVPGDLYIGGECLALGYTDGALTAERFRPNPFDEGGGARIYDTGDRARFMPDGNIEFLGRLDQQVKLRGFRIELGEIETVLARHERVREAAVEVKTDAAGERRLVGYFVSRVETPATTTELRAYLGEKLPEYMIPSAFVLLDRLPLTPNGKLDRKALPSPDMTRPSLAASYLAPTSELERRIAQVWQEALHLDKVGVRDNFFELGGHSLLLAQVHGRLVEMLKRELPIVALFKYPTIVSLAGHLSGAGQEPTVATSHRQRGQERREAIKERMSRR
ncbi:MAG TPA: amino acid adenylation domain-containing protein [Pyrinomonadaceae bacterium]